MYHIYSKVKILLKYSCKEHNICHVKRIYGLGMTTAINQKTQTTTTVSEIKKICSSRLPGIVGSLCVCQQTSITVHPVTIQIKFVVGWPWPAAEHPPNHSLNFLNKMGGENNMKRLVGHNKDVDIISHHHVKNRLNLSKINFVYCQLN